ncbi:MAG TPA: STAS domain-containing protein [Terriglobales bacterium]|nr:STAS domain-containing protein [Terriglobales bacterium]
MSTCACLQPAEFVPALIKEPKLTLRLEIREGPAVTVIHCKGRLVFREENCFSTQVLEVLSRTKQVVIDLSGVEMVDGFGLGELVTVQNLAKAKGCAVKLVAPTRLVYSLLKLTKLNSLFEFYPTLNEAAVEVQPAVLATSHC